MANLVNLGCKCGARGGDPSENSHYMIIHWSTPLCIRYCQCADLNCCIVCWVCVFCTQLFYTRVHSWNKTLVLCSMHENWLGSYEIVRTWQKLLNFVRHSLCSTTLLRGMIILGTLCSQMIILASLGIMQPGWEILLSGASSLHEAIYISHRFKAQSFHLDLQSLGITHRFKLRQCKHWKNEYLEALTCNSTQYNEKQ